MTCCLLDAPIVSKEQFINSSPPSVTLMRQLIRSALVQTMGCRIFGVKPLSKAMLIIVN